MSAKGSLAFTTDDRGLEATPPDLAPWWIAGEPMLPARNVAWATLALIVATLAVLTLA